MSIANKLSYLGETKGKIREGLNRLGGNISTSDTFRSYADAIEEIYDSMPKVEENDVTSATLNGTIKGGLDIDPKGNTSQNSTTGKNLLNASANKYDFSSSQTQTTLQVGTIDLVANTKYYISYTIDTATTSNLRNTPRLTYDGTTYYQYSTPNENLTVGRKVWEFTPTTSGNYDLRYWVNDLSNDISVSYFMISTSSDTTYEPYTNGASPNPSYPQQIHEVSGDNEVVVCGKNIFNSTIDNGGIDTTTGNEIVNYGYARCGYIQVIGGKDISVQYKNDLVSGQIVIYEYNENKTYLGFHYNNGKTYTRTLENNTKYIRLRLSGQAQTPLDEISNVMVEYSSTPSPYEPYQSQTYPINLPVENLVYEWHRAVNLYYLNETTEYANYVFKAGTYTLSYKNNSGSNIGCYLQTSDGTQQSLGNDTTITFTTTKDYNLWFYKSGMQDGDISEVQIEPGTKANHYTPYGTTPIKMRGIGTYEDYFVRNSGKNKWKGNKDYTGSGTVAQITQTLALGTYTISYNQSVAGTVQLNFRKSGSLVFSETIYSVAGNVSKTFNVNSEIDEIWIYLSVSMSISNIMINEGSTPLPYEPFGTGQWCKYNAIGKVVLDGSESWQLWNIDNTNTQRFYKTFNDGKGTSPNTFTNQAYIERFYYDGGDGDFEHYRGSASGGKPDLVIYINRNRLSSVDVAGLKAYFSSNNTKVYYLLATPYLSLIEDNNLIEQLNELENAMSYEGTTNIGQVNNDLPFKLDLKAILDWRNNGGE